MDSFFFVIFWISFWLIAYVYAGYPILLGLVSLIFKRQNKKGHQEPFVSVILSVFNEEKSIGEKIRNLLEINYPKDKIEILIGSDGAYDGTDQIISSWKSTQIRFFRFVSNLGKPNVLKSLVNEAKGSILVFTDARQEFHPDAIVALVRNFEDAKVGCVSGEMHYKAQSVQEGQAISKGMSAYWNIEKFLRKKESAIGSMLGATGAIDSIRKELFPELPDDTLADDMYIPLSIVRKGYRAIFESEAMAYETRVSQRGAEEMTRKVRTLAGNYQIFHRFSDLLIPGKSPIAWQLISHKLMRLLVPFFLVMLYTSNAFLCGFDSYFSFFMLQTLFYSLALFEVIQEGRGIRNRKGLGYIPYTFCLLNYSAFLAFFKYWRGNLGGLWKKAYA